jgi:hypothetical protein
MISRSPLTHKVPLNIVGSSTFGVYPKISIEKTYNMYISDNFMIDYGGYISVATNLGLNGRGIFTSNNLDRMIAVVENNVYLIDIIYDPNQPTNAYQFTPVLIGTLLTFNTDVFITENNANQIAISDGSNIYIYNPTAAITFRTFTSTALGFIPGYITFHDTYFLCAASQDTTYSPPANNTWRLSNSNDGTVWPSDAAHVGLLQTKPDTTQAVIRFPSGGNMIYVMGTNVTEPWFDQGLTLFPYQRNTGSTIDYGVINPSAIGSIDKMVVWLAQNEQSGPIIMVSDGGNARQITTDGIDHLLSHLKNPNNCEAFMFRKDGHIFYHINFYDSEDNVSLFYDFNTQKFFHASDENGNYFIAKQVAFFNNQYYFVSRNNGNIYAFDTNYTTYDGKEIPRIRVCKNIRRESQEYFVVNDLGFTIEQGITEPQYQNLGPCRLITEDGKYLITEGGPIFFQTQDGKYLLDQTGQNLISEQSNSHAFSYLVTEQDCLNIVYPRVDLSISTDGGESFGSYVPYNMNALGHRRNMIRWWQLGLANDFVAQFRFWGFGRFVATDGEINVRQ